MAHDAPFLRLIEAGLLASFAVFAWFRASTHLRMLFALIVALCAALAAWQGSAQPILSGLMRAMVFGAFIPAIVMLRATVETSPRIEKVRERLERVDGSAAEFLTLHAAHGLAGIINVGAAGVLAPVVAAAADDAARVRLASASARGVALAAMWSPFYLSVAFTVQLASVPMWQIIAIGLGCALIGLVIAYFMFTPRAAHSIGPCFDALEPLGIPIVVMLGSVVLASVGFGWTGLHAVAIVIPALCLAYSILNGKSIEIARSTFTMMGRVSNELLIVLSGTLLGSMAISIPAVQQLGTSVTPELISGPTILAAFFAVTLVLGQLGIHPMIVSGLLVPVLCLGNFGVVDAIVVATAVFAWAINATISIWTIPMAGTASAFQVPVGRLVTRRTMMFAVIYGLAGVAFLSMLNAIMKAWP